MKILYNLPKEVKFCKKCVNSNQYPASTVEFKHTKNRKGAKYINFNTSGICDGCLQAEVKNKETKKPLFKSLKKEEFMYFVHSYFVEPNDEKIVLSKTKYGKFEFCSSVCSKNLLAVQFHPEKSGLVGLKIYKNFKNLIKKANN